MPETGPRPGDSAAFENAQARFAPSKTLLAAPDVLGDVHGRVGGAQQAVLG
jgi:hypothetical protein